MTEPDAVTHPALGPRRGATRATTWWGKAWVRAIEETAYAEGDLRAGRALARTGAVGGITVSRGELVASVSDARGLWTARCRLPALPTEAQAALVEVVAAEVGRIGALLAGELPYELVEHADEAGAELLPVGYELESSCTCDAWLDPCPHALALLQQAARLVESDPLMLFHLRGLARDELVARLHARGHAVDEAEADAAALDVALDAALRAARLLEVIDGNDDPRLDHLL